MKKNYLKSLMAVLYLPASLGKKSFLGLTPSIAMVLEQTQKLVDHGIASILIENENDQPYSLKAPPEAISSMTRMGLEIKRYFPQVQLGVEFLINDPFASLAIAKACDAQFIRTDYFSDRMSREEYGGEIISDPVKILQYRQSIDAEKIKIFTDIQVKYATLLEDISLVDSAKRAELQGSDGVIVSGTVTGVAPNFNEVLAVKKAVKEIPVFIGSGLDATNSLELLSKCDGAMVGSALMEKGVISSERVLALKMSLEE